MNKLRVKGRDFACRCGDDGKARCASVMEWALKWMNTTPEDFVTRSIYELSWRWNATITGIPNDQWSAIVTERTGEKPWHTYIQCDRIEDGLAFTLRAYYDKYGKGSDW